MHTIASRDQWIDSQQLHTKVSFHLSGLSGPTSQFLNGKHEFSELVLARMALLMDQSRSVFLLRSPKAGEFGELWRENVRAPFSAGQNGQMESDLNLVRSTQ